MNKLKVYALFFVGELLLFLLIAAVKGSNLFDALMSSTLWWLLLILTLLGQLVGYIGTSISQNPGIGNKYYIGGHLFFLILFFMFYVLANISEWQRRKNNGNIDSNHSTMAYDVRGDEKYIRTAFWKLESQFENPNDIVLKSFTSRKKDTLVDNIADTIYNVYFSYNLGDDKNTEFFSKLRVFHDSANVSIHKINTNKSMEYVAIKDQFKKDEKAAVRTIRELTDLLSKNKALKEKQNTDNNKTDRTR